jgi:hypothetical protein
MKNQETDLIHELLKSVEVLGVEATTDALKCARSNTLTLDDKRIDFVLKMVSKHYMIPIDQIIYSNNKSVIRMFALKFCVYYLYDSFGFSFSELKKIFKRDVSLLSRNTTEIKILMKDNETIKNTKNKFDLLITDFKLQNKL